MFVLWRESNVYITERAKSVLAAFRMVAGENINISGK